MVGTGFGQDCFPLRSHSAVIMRLNLSEKKVTFLCNGRLIGDAFTVANSKLFDEATQYYPAASVSSPFQAVRLCPSGFDGSIVFPTPLILQKSAASCFARLAAVLLNGPLVDEKETSLMPWLRSPLLVGGLDERYLNERVHLNSWKSCWNSGRLDISGDLEEITPVGTLSRSSSLDATTELFIGRISSGDSPSDDAPLCRLFEDWLNDAVDRDNDTLRKVLEKSKTYSFPRCERPFIAAMLKHGGLLQEAMLAVSDLQDGRQPVPSSDMRSLWKRVRQLRVFLRQQRQLCMSAESSAPDSDPATPSTEDTIHPTAPDIVAADSVAPSSEAFQFFISKDIVWIEQRDVTSTYSAEYSCKVLSVGLDEVNSLVYIKFAARGNNSDGPLQAAADSVLQICEKELSFPAHSYDVNNPESEISGFLRYEAPPDLPISFLMREDAFFTYGSGGYKAARLTFSDSYTFSRQEADASISFQQICEDIEQRASFLLKLVYAGPAELPRVVHPRPGDSGVSTSAEGNERWRKVVEFLRVHTSSRKEMSRVKADIAFADIDEDPSITNEALKACALFLMSDASNASLSQLMEVIQRRNLRSSTRIFSMGSIAEALQHPEIRADTMALGEVLTYMRSSILGGSNTSAERLSGRIHYLCNLEGCTAQSFRQLQNAFLAVYSQFSNVLSSILELNEVELFDFHTVDKFIFNIINCLLAQWQLHFSSRDHKFLMDCGVLQVLYKLSGSAFYEKLALAYVSNCSKLVMHRASRPNDDLSYYTKPFLSGTLVENILNEKISLREVVFNLKILPESFISSEERKAVGLDEDFMKLVMMDSHQITLLFQKVIVQMRQKEEEAKAKCDADLAAKLEKEKEMYDAEFAIIRAAGIPLFDENRKADEVYLEGWDQIAGIKASRASSSVVSVFATIGYDVGIGGLVSGNYFEVTILEAGTKDIGIGLGTTEHFPVSGQMPGWEAHSYGRIIIS